MTNEELKHWRISHNLTQSALAKILQVNSNHIYLMETGRRKITHLMSMAIRSLDSKRARKSA